MVTADKSTFLKAYHQNEYDANRHMTFALSLTAIFLTVVWILYLIPGVFDVNQLTRLITCIALPIIIVILLTPLLFLKTKYLEKPGYKYFLLITFLLVIAVLNILIPKHAMIAWALPIVITNHYYNPKLSITVFVITMVLMFFCIYVAMFLGEYDPNLLTGSVDSDNLIRTPIDFEVSFTNDPKGRYEFLTYLLEHDINRFKTAFGFYFFPRALILTILFYICHRLNKRTNKLFVDEIEIGIKHSSQSKELEIAGEIQLSVLPESFKTTSDIEIIADLKPTKEVGGDFYDYYELDDSHIAILIGDVSGKGSPAAMFMMKTITCFKNFVNVNKTPSQIIMEVNRAVCEGNKNEMFVTCFLGILDIQTGILKYANAGHNPPIVGHNLHYQFLKCASGFVLGALQDIFVKDEEIKLDKGDLITLYTDGITEARNEKGDFFGNDHLINLFNRREYDTLLEMHYELKDELDTFIGNADQADDITFLTLKYKGGIVSYKEVVVAAKKENLKDINALLDKLVKQYHLESLENKLNVVTDEVFSNIAKYAYENGEGDVYFRCSYSVDKETLVLTFVDTGKEFNQLDVDVELVDESFMNKKEGGLGIHIVKNLVNKASYYHVNGKNILVLKLNK